MLSLPSGVEQILFMLGQEPSGYVTHARGTPMAVTMEQVVAALQPDEPDYAGASSFGTDAIPFLDTLIQGSDLMLAAKAAYLVGVIGGPRSGPILMRAAANANPLIRAAVAGAVVHLPIELSGPVIGRLLDDEHADVRRLALQSVQPGVAPELRPILEKIGGADPDPSVRSLAHEALRKIRRN
jgi:hypothetical protein